MGLILYIQPGFQIDGYPPCFSGTPFAIKVHRALQYKGLPHEVRAVEWERRAQQLPTLTSTGKLPVLEHDQGRIDDSTDIVRWLDANFPEHPLLPRDPLLRARCDLLEDWSDEVLHWYGSYETGRIDKQGLQARAYFGHLPEPLQEVAGRRLVEHTERVLDSVGLGRYPQAKVERDLLRGLDALLAWLAVGPFLAGPELSVADLAIFGQLTRRMAGTHPWIEAHVRARPALVDWLARVDAASSGTVVVLTQ